MIERGIYARLVTCPSRAIPIALILSALPSVAGNQALVTGAYGGTLGAGGATAADRSGFGSNPAALRPWRAGAQAHFHRPYGLDDLQVSEADVYADAGRFGAAFAWRDTGLEGWYGEQGLQASQTLRLGRTGNAFPGVLDLGAAWDRWKTVWPGGGEEVAWSHGFGAAWRMLPRLKAGAFISGIPLDPGGSGGADRIVQWGLEADSRNPEAGADGSGTVAPSGGADGTAVAQILRLDFRKTGETPWRVLASLSVRPHPTLEITGGLANPPFQASLGMRFAWKGAEWHQALRYHRYLGRTWLSGLAFSTPLR
ncbi:MAG: hypothetical protein JWP91_2261 [Fibrobacteres bacterium]|nr:hypothetical protein [Fibrobacterota bacterium]